MKKITDFTYFIYLKKSYNNLRYLYAFDSESDRDSYYDYYWYNKFDGHEDIRFEKVSISDVRVRFFKHVYFSDKDNYTNNRPCSCYVFVL